ncbi:MAG TPA: hypothetical protein PK514_10020 [Spirochaetota bacterium]|nr:hypothetical protein [Spirochaetota bacterium]
MISTIPVLIQTFSSIIQAAMTIGVLVVTLLYVIFTKKMLDQNYSTFVIITGLKHSGKKIFADIENHGTTIALNVTITAVYPGKNSPLTIQLKGPNMITPGEKLIFKGELPSTRDDSIIRVEICYRSQTRKKRTEIWKYREDEFIFLGNK